MANTLGQRIAEFRRARSMGQAELAEQLGITPQAVSKWENDIACPDIMLLPRLAELLDTTVDALLTDKANAPTTILVPQEKRKSINDMVLRIRVRSNDSDKVNINLPLPLVKVCIESGLAMPQFEGKPSLSAIDLTQMMTLVEQGVIGKLVEVESADGDIVEIFVE